MQNDAKKCKICKTYMQFFFLNMQKYAKICKNIQNMHKYAKNMRRKNIQKVAKIGKI